MTKITEKEAYEMYNQNLNELNINEILSQFSTARAVEELDPTLYNCGFNDFLDSLLSDGTEVEGLTEGDLDEE